LGAIPHTSVAMEVTLEWVNAGMPMVLKSESPG
jgi:hypothetical protein